MVQFDTALPRPSALSIPEAARRFLLSVYKRMAFAVLLSFASATVFTASGLTLTALQGLGKTLVLLTFFAQMGVIIAFQASVFRLSQGTVRALFGAYSVLMGFTLSVLGYVYPASTLGLVFLIAAGGFLSLVITGSVIKRDLGPVGTFCSMGLGMLFLLSLVGVAGSFFPAFAQYLPELNFVSGALGTVAFAGYTAYDAQRIRGIAYALGNDRSGGGVSSLDVHTNSAAFSMYLNFMGLFLSLLRLFGRK